MQALLRTTHIETAAPAQRAGREDARSCLHQIQGRRADAFVPAAAVDQREWDRSASCRAGLLSMTLPDLLKTGAGFGRRPFPHSHRLAVLPRLSRKRVCCSLQHTRAHSLRVVACKRSHAHPVAHQHLQEYLADVRHFLNRLSSSPSSAGFKTSEKALTDDEILFDAGSTSHD